jgi:glycosyltransferase involved in cell wall biosynthesis
MISFKKRKNTIGLVLSYLKSRGTERQALKLAKGFIEKGAHVVLFVVQGWGLEHMYQAFRDAGAEVVNVGKPKTIGQKSVNLSRVFSLAMLARKYRCDILLSRVGRSNQICGLAGRLAFIPTISVLSGPALPRRVVNNRFKRLILAIRIGKRFGFPGRIVSVSKEGGANFSVFYPFWSKRVTAIPNGVDISLEKQNADSPIRLNKQKFHLCFSGSLELSRKGLDLLLEALKHLVFSLGRNRICLVLIGTGEDEAKLRDLVQEYGLIDHVVFAGEQSNPFPIIKQCNVFVLPSRYEGFPNALLEAMALGLCCISADCDTGPREIIENGQNGLLVPVGDNRALADAIARVEQDFDLRNRLARNGLKTITERFSSQTMIDAYYELIMRIR